jgi:Gylcosyl hydrolase family 115 C-terminal domain
MRRRNFLAAMTGLSFGAPSPGALGEPTFVQGELRFFALDAGVVLQRLVIDAGGLAPSALGPPESPRPS